MKKTILITLMVMLTLTIGAQNAAQARKVLDKTAAVVSNTNGATAQFTLSSTKTGTVSGRLSLKGNKFQVTTPHSIIWYNGKTQWSYLKSTEEVNVSTPTAAQQPSWQAAKSALRRAEAMSDPMTAKRVTPRSRIRARASSRLASNFSSSTWQWESNSSIIR